MKRKHLAFGCKIQRKNSSKLNPLHSKSSFKHASLSGAPALGGSCWLLERDRLTWARKKHYTATRLSKEVTKVLKAHSLGHRSPWRAGCIAQKQLSALVRHISRGLYIAPGIPIVRISSSLDILHTKRVLYFNFSYFSLIYRSDVIIINYSCLRRPSPHPPTSLDWY